MNVNLWSAQEKIKIFQIHGAWLIAIAVSFPSFTGISEINKSANQSDARRSAVGAEFANDNIVILFVGF